MQKSEQINELAAALAKAQGEMGAAKKDATNPFFKSSYADLTSIWEACQGPLSKNGLAVLQIPCMPFANTDLYLETVVTHSSGQWISGLYPIHPVKQDPQGWGSAVKYARRYSLEAMLSIVTDDDDGEAAMGRGKSHQPQQSKPPSQADYPHANPNWQNELATDAQVKRLFALSKQANYTEGQLKELVMKTTQKDSTKSLTKSEIQKLFAVLEGNVSKEEWGLPNS